MSKDVLLDKESMAEEVYKRCEQGIAPTREELEEYCGLSKEKADLVVSMWELRALITGENDEKV